METLFIREFNYGLVCTLHCNDDIGIVFTCYVYLK
jgi:hypothetical protein